MTDELSTRDMETRAVAEFDALTGLVANRPEVRAAYDRLTVDVAEVIRVMVAHGIDPATAAAAVAGQVSTATLLTIIQIGEERR